MAYFHQIKGWILLLALFLCFSPQVSAHHNSMTSKAGEISPILSLNENSGDTVAYQLNTRFSLEIGHWHKPQELSKEIDLGRLEAYQFKLAQNWYLNRDQSLSIILPIGIYQRYSEHQMNRSSGLGDLFIYMQQRSCSQKVKGRRFCMAALLGLTIPTGEYGVDQKSTTNMLTTQDSGSFIINTFNAQTSLGADTWSVFIGGRGDWYYSHRFHVFTEMGYLLPMTETQDQILWGRDLFTKLSVVISLVDWGGVQLGGIWQKHGYDTVPNIEQEQQRVEVGGRQTFGINAGAFVKLNKKTSCEVGVEYTPWRELNAPQLIKTSSLRIGCLYSWGTQVN
jgi:hypothetical protein